MHDIEDICQNVERERERNRQKSRKKRKKSIFTYIVHTYKVPTWNKHTLTARIPPAIEHTETESNFKHVYYTRRFIYYRIFHFRISRCSTDLR